MVRDTPHRCTCLGEEQADLCFCPPPEGERKADARADGLERFLLAAHALCDAFERRDMLATSSSLRLLCVARARARAEQAALEHAFDMPRRAPG